MYEYKCHIYQEKLESLRVTAYFYRCLTLLVKKGRRKKKRKNNVYQKTSHLKTKTKWEKILYIF